MTEDVRLESLRSIKLFLRVWLEKYSEDFAEPPDYPNLNELNRFAHSHLNDAELIKTIRAKFDQFEKAAATSEDDLVTSSPAATAADGTESSNENGHREKLNMSDEAEWTGEEAKRPGGHRRSYSNLAQPSHGLSAGIETALSRSQVDLDKAFFKSLLLSSIPHEKNLEDSGSLANTLLNVNSRFIAEQLTYLDKCLFQRIYAYHCLASGWNTKNKVAQHKKTSSEGSGGELTQSTSSSNAVGSLSNKFPSMRAFIDQFNRVSFVVQVNIYICLCALIIEQIFIIYVIFYIICDKY